MAYLSVPKISRHLIFLHLSSPFIVDNCSYISILSFAITYYNLYPISLFFKLRQMIPDIFRTEYVHLLNGHRFFLAIVVLQGSWLDGKHH